PEHRSQHDKRRDARARRPGPPPPTTMQGDLMMAESVPVTAEVLARALATLPKPPWYEAEPFKTLLAVVIGGFLTLAANWWLKHLELRARANSLKVAFRGKIGALRGSLRVEAKHARMTYEADGLLAGGVTYSRTVFEQNASH